MTCLDKSIIKESLEEAFKKQLYTTLGNLKTLPGKKLDNINLFKLTALTYRYLNGLLESYSDLITEMVASPYSYKTTSFLILDTKFITWKAWLEVVTALFRFYMMDRSINGKLPKTILHLTETAKELYETELISISENAITNHKELIDYFLKLHQKTYETFMEELQNIISHPPNSDFEIFDMIQKLAFCITKWMQYTTFEVLSLDRVLYGDKVVIVSGIVVSIALENNLNLVKEIRQLIPYQPIEIRFTQPILQQYKFLFEEEFSDEQKTTA